jgi:integrase
MRVKDIFTVYPRKLKNVTVYYYQCYDKNGKRINGHSTGQVTRTAAKAYCTNLYREGNLIPKEKGMTFGEYAVGWWDLKTCKYLEWRQLEDPLTQSTIDVYRETLEGHIKEYFGGMYLEEITEEDIKKWVVSLANKSLKNTYINSLLNTLRIMLREAVRRKLITDTPMRDLKKLKEVVKEVDILTAEEVNSLFPAKWDAVWDTYEVYMLNWIAANTGMRLGEVMGLRCEYIFEECIHVCMQYSDYGYVPLKTKDSRTIPIIPEIYEALSVLIKKNPKGFIFSEDGGETPITRSRIYQETEKALDAIGIKHDERIKRGIAIHHWRHYLNSALIMANVSILKVQKVTGHKTLGMTKRYTQINTKDFTEVLDVQRNMLKKPKADKGGKGAAKAGDKGNRKPAAKKAGKAPAGGKAGSREGAKKKQG